MVAGQAPPRSANGPIFIAGASRSGKTLLRWILSSHPRIVVSRRTEMWPRFGGRFGDLARPGNLDRCLRALLERPQVAALHPDPERIRREFAAGAPTYARLFALMHEHYAEACGKARWGDQTGQVDRFADHVLAAYPGARMIHLVRDPRDRHVAILERAGRSRGDAGASTGSWLSSVATARRNTRRYPGRYRILRYETLVRAPEETVRSVCGFLGEAFEPSMLDMPGARRYDDLRAAGNGTPITAAHVGVYHQRLDQRDLAFIQVVADGSLVAMGYQPQLVTLSPGDCVRGAARTWPADVARLAGWRMREAIGGRPTAHVLLGATRWP